MNNKITKILYETKIKKYIAIDRFDTPPALQKVIQDSIFLLLVPLLLSRFLFIVMHLLRFHACITRRMQSRVDNAQCEVTAYQ